jgi:hypothetical protein
MSAELELAVSAPFTVIDLLTSLKSAMFSTFAWKSFSNATMSVPSGAGTIDYTLIDPKVRTVTITIYLLTPAAAAMAEVI